MTTRFTVKTQSRFGHAGLPSGYNDNLSPNEFTIPSCGLFDVDTALFALFDKEIPLACNGPAGAGGAAADIQRCPVIFSAGEKWALAKKLRARRDRNGALILPLCTIIRKSLEQDWTDDITGRGINQQTGEIVIHRRLDKSDRVYQQLINRLLLVHQQNLAVTPATADPGQLTTLREIGDLADDQVVQQGGLLVPNRQNNVFETIVIPAPQFFTAEYEVTLWAQYTKQMNQLLEGIISSQLPQGNVWRLMTPKGYWFLANVDDHTYSADDNLDDFSQKERMLKYKFTIKVPAYILASRVPGAPVPIKRYVSTPTIEFSTGIVNSTDQFGGTGTVDDPFLGADDPTLPLSDSTEDYIPDRKDQRRTDGILLYPGADVPNPDDPAVLQLNKKARGSQPAQYQKVTGKDKNGNQITRLFRVKGQNTAQGETVLAAGEGLGGLTIEVDSD